MITINLLPWREKERRRRRRNQLLGIGLGVLLLLGIVLLAQGVFQHRHDHLLKKVSKLQSSVRMAMQELEERDNVLKRVEKTWQMFQEQKEWREGFRCQAQWLRELGDALPLQCSVDNVTVNKGRWCLVVHCGREFSLKNMIQKMSSLPKVEQLTVGRMDVEEKPDLFRVELNAVSHCGVK